MLQKAVSAKLKVELAKRLELKIVDKSGTSTSVVEKARKDLNAYSFLFWIDEYQLGSHYALTMF